MTLKLTCCVCDRPGIEGNTCPNCETDLSMVRMLMELPIQPTVPDASAMTTSDPLAPRSKPWSRLLGIGLLLLGLGIVLGITGNQMIATESSSSLTATTALESPTTVIQSSFDPENNGEINLHAQAEPLSQNKSNSCGGFYYTIRPGDSLSKIAWSFYGRSTEWPILTVANSQLQGQEHQLIIGNTIFIPNQEEQCPNL